MAPRPPNPEPDGDAQDGDAGYARDSQKMWAPLWVALAWLIGTYGAFWTTGLSDRVTDPIRLHIFVSAATGAFALGYALLVKKCPPVIDTSVNTWGRLVAGRRLVLAGAIYLALFGVLQMLEYGATGFGSILARIQDPGSAYQAKFGVYAVQAATGRVSAPMQLVTLAGALYGVTGPLLVIFWRKLTLALKMAGVAGLATYGVYFLFIGTQKGLGDIVVMVLAGALIGSCGTWWTSRSPGGSRRKALRYAAVAMTVFLIYMVSAQTQRAQEFGTRDVTPPSPAVAAVLGDKTATGVAATLFYPTHGYLGLSYNLGSSFQWTGGLGASPVVASYATQYFSTSAPPTYPARTETRTGWPAGLYWATIYPWLASDLTFPGAVLFMVCFGWLFAKMWVEGAVKRDILAVVIFGQLAIAVAYIPANNQLGNSRPTTIGLATLLVVYAVRSFSRNVGKRRLAESERSRSVMPSGSRM